MRLKAIVSIVLAGGMSFAVMSFPVGTEHAAASQRTSGPATRNPSIPKIVAEISARNIEATIRKLVSFGTRNTLSEQNNPNRGVGAARDWLYAEFQKVSAQSGGRM